MQSSLSEPGCLRPCPSYSRRRDRIILGLLRSLCKGGGVPLLSSEFRVAHFCLEKEPCACFPELGIRAAAVCRIQWSDTVCVGCFLGHSGISTRGDCSVAWCPGKEEDLRPYDTKKRALRCVGPRAVGLPLTHAASGPWVRDHGSSSNLELRV